MKKSYIYLGTYIIETEVTMEEPFFIEEPNQKLKQNSEKKRV